jgi:hypothetical protein
MIENYLHNPKRHISGNVLSASCRCPLIGVNPGFIHAAAKSFVEGVFMPIRKVVTEVKGVHSADSQW